jgi:hypothetical protein
VGESLIIGCDAKCSKAWGISSRPRVQLSENEDDYAYLSDDELPDAPDDPGTYEGGHGKPLAPFERLNKWCFRECERSGECIPGAHTGLGLKNFYQRVYNRPDLHADLTSP